ncbi:hypothetical protein B0H21DRAFT_780430 [Amylocystis lapponica]|nr:hypothetical protein B0H21DRAFT_780430 [Amylocystis lapponica]
MWTCIRTYFQHSTANQVMLFERAPILPAVSSSSLPPVLTDLLGTLADLLRPLLPSHTHALLFPPPDASTRARQAILNLYWPGEGITPHVDLLDRFGDGIVGVSLGSGCVMRFDRVAGDGMHGAEERGRWDVYLPQGSVLVMSEEARYGWTHGIEKRMEDLVEDSGESERAAESCSWVERDVRLSITFRWLLPGADIVGGHPAEGHA